MQPEFPDEDIMALFEGDQEEQNGKIWMLLFDGASNVMCFNCTNNIAEYEACALGIQAAIESKENILNVYGDSTFVIHQLKGEWETRDPKLIPYRAYIMELVEYFESIEFQHIPREDNQLADAL